MTVIVVCGRHASFNVYSAKTNRAKFSRNCFISSVRVYYTQKLKAREVACVFNYQALDFCCFSCLAQIEQVCCKVDFEKTDKTKAFDQLNRF